MTDHDTYQAINEKDLFTRIAMGDEDSFTRFVELYGPEIQRSVRQVVRTEAVIKDLTQDIFLQLWIGREKLANLEAPRAWVFRVVYYQCYYWLRQQATRDRGRLQLLEQSVTDPWSQDDQAVFADTKRLIREAINELPPRTKQIYQLSREAELSIPEIGVRLGISEQTVKNTLSTALQRMRESLNAKGIGLPIVLFWLFTG